jgi:ABC-type nitrate/sulfonate/bicarbonate transport system ATPase subunit
MIRVRSLVYGYQQPLFDEFSWEVGTGEHWTILGPSGCGKTTLLKLLAGLYRPHAGTVEIMGQALTRPRPNTGLILQNYGLLPWAPVWANVALGLRIRRFYGRDGIHTPKDRPLPSARERHATVEHWLKRLNIWDLRRSFPGQLSGGQQQRVAIARTLALAPDLLLMDEPFNSLDAPTRKDLQNLVLSLRAELSVTTVIVTHALDEAAILGSKILVMRQPPQTHPTIVENPAAESPDYRQTPTYLDMRNHLQEMLA